MPRTPRRLVDFSREMRRNPTEAERALWPHLRKRQLNGYRFRRQHTVGPFIVDFACLDPRLAIELDGSQHLEQPQRDERRDAYLASKGFKVLHFTNRDVLTDMQTVLEVILRELDALR